MFGYFFCSKSTQVCRLGTAFGPDNAHEINDGGHGLGH